MNAQLQTQSDLPPLPATSVTGDGQEYRPHENTWRFAHASKPQKFWFTGFVGIVTDELLHCIKVYLVMRLKHFSCASARSFMSNLLCTLKRARVKEGAPITEIDVKHLLAAQGGGLMKMRGILINWHETCIPGISDTAYVWLREKKIRQVNHKVVLTADPVRGPLEELELALLLQALRQGLAGNEIDMEEYLLVCLLAMFGPRPAQVSLLRCSDLSKSKSGRPRIRIPSLKNGRPPRIEFYDRALDSEYASLLEKHIEGRMVDYPNHSPDDVAMFRWAHGGSIGEKLTRLAGGPLKIPCERTGAPQVLAAVRLRHTLATRAAEEGYGARYIAELLDHTTEDTAKAYINARPSAEARITAALSPHLIPLAQAFNGTLVKDESMAVRGEDPASRVRSPGVGNVGTCGSFSYCGGWAPVACYTCGSFQPWLDAPHEALLMALLRNRKEALEETGDVRYASAQDLTIRAVAHVVELCRAAKGGAE